MTASKFIVAVLATSATASVMAADYRIYGKAEVQIANTDKGVMRYTKAGTQIDAPFSRIGVKGEHTLASDLKLVYKYEVQVKGFEHDDTTEPFSARNTYLGLAGQFGTVLIGRNDTRFKFSEGKVDQFNETQSDIAQVLAGQDRVGDSITYTSPNWNNMSFSLTYTPKDDASNEQAGFAATAIYGDRALKNKQYYIALSHTDSIGNLLATRIALAYKWQKLQLGAIIQDSENLAKDKSGKGYVVSASYQLSDHWRPKLQFARDTSGLRHNEDATQWSLGTDYLFDKQTNLYAMATRLNLDTEDDTSIALGLKYRF
ncbi:porin [Pseudoalteromonas peptidolytica]|uniref:porin n=1 Tax=Pseudoalteromonas peptidolytica TaxID=61150 RepID=UPI00298EC851|nr:porin [Pseudoalteromonas peptidolytica]MDW7548486.1 porin [Pseudoalteromonas peptidolytica]